MRNPTRKLAALAALACFLFVLYETWPRPHHWNPDTPPRCVPVPTPSPKEEKETIVFKREDYWTFLSDLMSLQGEGIEGFMVDQEANYYQRLGAEPFVRTVCEIGFNAGHSTAMWLTAGERKLKVYSFDLGDHKYTPRAKQFLDLAFPGRVSLTLGDSTKSVPMFTSDAANKGLVCDIIHVDGGHYGEIPLLDLRNMRPLAGTNTILLIDDVNCADPWCVAPQKAWDQLKAEGEIEECQCFSVPSRGWCVGRYVKPGHTTHDASNVCSTIAARHSTH